MSIQIVDISVQNTDISTEKQHIAKHKYRCKADIIAAILQAAASGEVSIFLEY
jgi:hypothetical protein